MPKKKKGSGKKKKGKGKAKKGSGKKKAKTTKAAAPAQRSGPLFTNLRLCMATFAQHEDYPCHFEAPFPVHSSVGDVLDAINARMDHTASELYLFRAELKGGTIVQDGPALAAGSTLEELELPSGFLEDVREAEPCCTLFYDYRPFHSASPLVTDDQYFTARVADIHLPAEPLDLIATS